MTKRIVTYTLVLAALLSAACSRTEELQIPQSTSSKLVVQAELVSASDWTKIRSGSGTIYGTAVESIDGEYLITATKEEWTGSADSLFATTSTSTPVTRGTPIVSSSGIPNIRVNIFRTGETNWTTSSKLTSAIAATNSGGSFTTSPGYNWVSDATAKTSLFAFSPIPSGSNGLSDNLPNKIGYTVPTDVTKQPDLCTATPSLDILNDNGSEQNRTFFMSHQLTAVGFSMLGWNLKITKITISGVAVTGTLTMNTTGAATWVVSGTDSRDVGVTQSSYQHTINSAYADITTSNGYLMMIPQALSDAAMVKIDYTSTGTGSANGSITTKLKDLGVTWNAGDKVTYNIRLKTAPAVTSGDLVIKKHIAGYTTSSAMSMVMDSRDNLTFTWNASWLKIHKGNPKEGDTSGGAVSGWTTGTGGPWSNIYFFATSSNTSPSGAGRTATVTVTGTRSGSKTFSVTQQARKVNPPSSWVEYNNLRWALGPLVGVGDHECKVGLPTHYGLYFRFGSLIGWSSGGGNNDGTTPGFPPSLYAKAYPVEMKNRPTSWHFDMGNAEGAKYYLYDISWTGKDPDVHLGSYNKPFYGDTGVGNAASGRYAPLGVGDPCTFYLGLPWRMPTQREMNVFRHSVSTSWAIRSDVPGRYLGGLFFAAGGYRNHKSSDFASVGSESRIWTASPSVYDGFYLYMNKDTANSPDKQDRGIGASIRCVSPAS